MNCRNSLTAAVRYCAIAVFAIAAARIAPAQTAAPAQAGETPAPAQVSPAGSAKLKRSYRPGANRRAAPIVKGGRPVAPAFAPIAPAGAPKPEQRYLPGYRPATPQAIVEFENYKRAQRGQAGYRIEQNQAPTAKGKGKGKTRRAVVAQPPLVSTCRSSAAGEAPKPMNQVPAAEIGVDNRAAPAQTVAAGEGVTTPAACTGTPGAKPIGTDRTPAQQARDAAAAEQAPVTPGIQVVPAPAPAQDTPRAQAKAGAVVVDPQSNLPVVETREGQSVFSPAVRATLVDPRDIRAYDPSQVGPRQSKPARNFFSPEEQERQRLEALNAPPTPGVQVVDDAARAKGGSSLLAAGQTDPNAPPTAGVSFASIDGAIAGGGYPPDTMGAAGPNHLGIVVNSMYRFYNKSTGAQVATNSFQNLFSTTTNCNGFNPFLFDPSIDYDEENNRFIMLIQNGASAATSWLCVAVSRTGDPTGQWWTYAFRTNANNNTFWLDNAEIAMGLDAVYISGQMFDGAGAFQKSMLYAMQKTQMYSGAAATMVERDIGAATFNPQPMHIRGFAQGQWPAAGSAHAFFSRGAIASTTIYKWTAPFGANTLTSATITTQGTLTQPSTPEPGGAGTLPNDSGDTRWMVVQYRNGKLWASRGVGCNPGTGTVACAHWIEVNYATNAIIQEGIFSSNATYRTYPSLAVDRNNSVAMGYSRGATTEFTSAVVTGRDAGDPINTMQAAEIVHKAGEANYTDGEAAVNRWGDYSGMVVDPDGCRFWYFGQYAKSIGSPNWATWIRGYQFASCSVSSSISVNKSTYTCADSLTVTVTDVTATPSSWPASQVTLTTSNGDSETIAAGNWVGSGCAGLDCTTWVATIPVSSAAVSTNNGTLNVANAGTLTAFYDDTHGGHLDQSRTVTVDCDADIADGGYLVQGGCDESTTGPEKYTPYLDNGELISYTAGIFNNLFTDLTDARVTLSVTGAGAGNVTVLGNSTVNVGRIPARGLTGAIFSLSVSGAAPMTPVTLNFSLTSPADGYIVPIQISQAQMLESDDVIVTQTQCFNHDAVDMTARVYGTSPALPWTRATGGTGCSYENRTDGACDSLAFGVYKTGAAQCSGGGGTGNFLANADEVLFSTPFQPVNRGNHANGQPWRYFWLKHSAYGVNHATVTPDQSSVWGGYYNDNYGSATAPTTGAAIDAFPYNWAYYYGSIWASAAVNDWDVANTGTPDSLTAAPPNQLVLPLDASGFGVDVTGLSLNSTYFIFAHEGMDINALTGGTTANTRGFSIDNDAIFWDEFHAQADGNTCTTQCGTIGFDKYSYGSYPTDSVLVTVVDGNAGAGPLSVTITTIAGDSETVSLVKQGAEPRYTATITLYHNQGGSPADGKLYALATDTLTAVYNDASNGSAPCSDTAIAQVSTPGGDVIYAGNAISTNALYSNGDLDIFGDTNETVSYQVSIRNNMTTPLTNATVRITTDSPWIDCIIKDTATYGTVAPGATATNAVADMFKFHVKNTTACADPANPPTATFKVYITGTDFAGSASAQAFTVSLDITPGAGAPGTYTQAFTTDPGWTMGTTGVDEDGVCTGEAWVNDWKWTATHGRTTGGYTAWQTDVDFNLTGTYRVLSDSVLYTPVFYMGNAGNTVLTVDREYETEQDWDGAAIQYSRNGGPWTYITMPGMTPHNFASAATACASIDHGVAMVWQGAASAYATAASPAITVSQFDTMQFRFRLSADSSVQAAGLGIDNVQVTNIQPFVCDANANSGLPACPVAGPRPVPDGMTATKSGGNVTVTYAVASCGGGASNYNVLWGSFPITSATQALTGGSCGIGTSGSWTGNIPNNAFWVVVGTDGANFSSFGLDSSGGQQTFTGAPAICTSQTTQNTSATCN